jgi:hypothetical protein
MFWNCGTLTTFVADLSSLTGVTDMFKICTKLTTFTSDLSSLTGGNTMFYHCSALTAFSSDLTSLTSGNNMFRDCRLDAQSVERILTTIPDRGSEYLKTIGITRDVAACPKASEIVGLQEGQIIPQNPDEIPVRHRGWCCYLSCANGSYTVPNITNKYDVSEANGYIPDASKWHDEVYVPNDLTIIQVRNGIAYDDDAVDPEL